MRADTGRSTKNSSAAPSTTRADSAIARPGRASSDRPARTTSSAEPTVIGSVIHA